MEWIIGIQIKLLRKGFSTFIFKCLNPIPILWPKSFNIFYGVNYDDLNELDIMREEKEHSFVLGRSITIRQQKALYEQGWRFIDSLDKKLYVRNIEKYLVNSKFITSTVVSGRLRLQIGLTLNEEMLLDKILRDDSVSIRSMANFYGQSENSVKRIARGLKRKLGTNSIKLTVDKNGRFSIIS